MIFLLENISGRCTSRVRATQTRQKRCFPRKRLRKPDGGEQHHTKYVRSKRGKSKTFPPYSCLSSVRSTSRVRAMQSRPTRNHFKEIPFGQVKTDFGENRNGSATSPISHENCRAQLTQPSANIFVSKSSPRYGLCVIWSTKSHDDSMAQEHNQ